MSFNAVTWVREGTCFRCTSHSVGNHGYVKAQRYGKYTTIPRLILFRRFKGKLDKNVVCRHTCDNRWCIRPDHIVHGSHADNVRDKVERGRCPTGETAWNSQLTRSQADQIKVLLLNGVYARIIAARFEV